MAPGYLSLSALRLFTGLPHGTYFGVAALVAAALAPPGRRARAVGWVMLGLTSATLVGVPIALMFVLGLYPRLVLDVVNATAVQMVEQLKF